MSSVRSSMVRIRKFYFFVPFYFKLFTTPNTTYKSKQDTF